MNVIKIFSFYLCQWTNTEKNVCNKAECRLTNTMHNIKYCTTFITLVIKGLGFGYVFEDTGEFEQFQLVRSDFKV